MIKYLKDLKKIYLILLILFISIFIISGLTAYYTPYSGRAVVEYTMFPLYSKLQGDVEEIFVEDGQMLEMGDPIFRIDNEKLNLTLEDLKYQYRNEQNSLAALDLQILEAKREVLKAKQKLSNDRSNYDRYMRLYTNDFVSKTEYERYKLIYDNTKEEVEISKLSVTSLEKERGNRSDEENEILKSIEANIKKVKKDIEDSVVKAPYSGKLFIQQLHRGQSITSSSSYGYITNDNEDIYVQVDYMEKSVSNIELGQSVLITFDAVPGKIFKGSVDRTTTPQSTGYSSPGKLTEIGDSTRWIRTTGRSRVRVVLDDELPEETNIDSGSKAAVTLVNKAHPVLSVVSGLWIKIISALNYVY